MADKDATKSEIEEPKTKQVGVRFKQDAIARIDTFVARFKKDDRATVIREIFMLYADFYEEIEQARISMYSEQKRHYNPDAEIGKSKPSKGK